MMSLLELPQKSALAGRRAAHGVRGAPHGVRRFFLAALALFALSARAAEPPALLLAENYRSGVDVRRYLVSEKFDGVRAYWDGQRLLTRGGNVIHAPTGFTAALPPHPLDGELWAGRGRFEFTSAAIRRDPPDEAEWRQLRYLLFELPGASGPFAERAQRLREIATHANVPWLHAVDQARVADAAALQRRLRAVVKAGGEGLMLHRADASYVTGRSEVLLKLKPQDDAEAVVIGHLPGRGRLTGLLGSLRVRTADGREFSLGTGLTDAERRAPPPVGTVVTYRYRGLTANGLPRFASYWRVRSPE